MTFASLAVAGSIGDIAASPLLRRAVVEAVLVGGLCGAVGVHVLLRRLPFFAMTLSHATFPGVVIASLLGLPLLLGAWLFAAVVVAVTVVLGAVGRVEDTSATGVVLAGSLGLGTLLVSAQAGFTRDLSAFLVGSILSISWVDVALTAVIGVVALGVLASCHKELVLRAFDPDAADALGYSRVRADLLLFGVLAAVLAGAVPAVGVVLTVALLVAPAAAARFWTDRLVPTMVLGATIGAASGGAGVVVSHAFDLAAGGAIVLTAIATVVPSMLFGPHGGIVARR